VGDRTVSGARLRGLGGQAMGRWAIGLALAFSSLALCAPPAAAKRPSDRDLVDVYAAVEGAHLGIVLPGGPEKFIEVVDSPQYKLVVHEYGETFVAGAVTQIAWNTAGTEAIGAKLTVYGISRSGPEGLTRGVIAHEVFHVFEARLSGDEATQNAHLNEGWLEEGAAGWVESDLVHNDPTVREYWKDYLKSPGTELFKRSYAGIGFFGHMASAGIDPWTKFKSIFATTSSAAAYTAAIGSSTSFLDSEASVFFREPALGSVWDQQGPNVPSAKEVGFKPVKVNATAKAIPPLAVKPYADGAYDLTISGMPATEPVLELTVVQGDVRLRSTSGGSVDEVDPRQLLLCSDPKGCSCPSRPNHYLEFQRGDLAITGGPTGGEVRLVAHKPCEEILPAVSCLTLLPGFTQLITSVGGKPTSTESRRPDGTSDSACTFLYKGMERTNAEGEEVFEGVTALVVNVLRASSIGGAINYFKLSSPPLPGFNESRPVGIGEEAALYTREGVSATGAAEYGSSAIVRVHNIVASYTLVGTPGNSEADPEASLKLLHQVAAGL